MCGGQMQAAALVKTEHVRVPNLLRIVLESVGGGVRCFLLIVISMRSLPTGVQLRVRFLLCC